MEFQKLIDSLLEIQRVHSNEENDNTLAVIVHRGSNTIEIGINDFDVAESFPVSIELEITGEGRIS